MSVEFQWFGPLVSLIGTLIALGILWFLRGWVARIWTEFGFPGPQYVPRAAMAVIVLFGAWSVYTAAGTYGPKLTINQPRPSQYERGGSDAKPDQPAQKYEDRFNDRLGDHLLRLEPKDEENHP